MPYIATSTYLQNPSSWTLHFAHSSPRETSLGSIETLNPALTRLFSPENKQASKETLDSTIENTIALITDSLTAPPTSTSNQFTTEIVQNGIQSGTTSVSNPTVDPLRMSMIDPSQSSLPSKASTASATESTHSTSRSVFPKNTTKSDIIIGSVVGSVLGVTLLALLAFYCLKKGPFVRNHVKRKLEYEKRFLDSPTQLSTDKARITWTSSKYSLPHTLKIYSPEESVDRLEAPTEFDSSPFDSEDLLKINRLTVPKIPPKSEKRMSQRPLSQFYQVKLRPEILPARKAPPPPTQDTSMKPAQTPTREAHISNESVLKAVNPAPTDEFPSNYHSNHTSDYGVKHVSTTVPHFKRQSVRDELKKGRFSDIRPLNPRLYLSKERSSGIRASTTSSVYSPYQATFSENAGTILGPTPGPTPNWSPNRSPDHSPDIQLPLSVEHTSFSSLDQALNMAQRQNSEFPDVQMPPVPVATRKMNSKLPFPRRHVSLKCDEKPSCLYDDGKGDYPEFIFEGGIIETPSMYESTIPDFQTFYPHEIRPKPEFCSSEETFKELDDSSECDPFDTYRSFIEKYQQNYPH